MRLGFHHARNIDPLQGLYTELCEGLGVTCAIEAGAREATFSAALSERLPSATIIALEANPHAFARYRPTLPPAVHYLNCAASNEVGEVSFNIVRSLTPGPARRRLWGRGSGRLKRTNGVSSLLKRSDDAAVYEQVRVPATTIDTLLHEHGDPDRVALWIDVEGASKEVLEGAKNALQGAVRCVFIEVEERSYWKGQWLASDVRAHLGGLGFIEVPFPIRSPQYNAIFFRPKEAAAP